jgi:hypothetical protein
LRNNASTMRAAVMMTGGERWFGCGMSRWLVARCGKWK